MISYKDDERDKVWVSFIDDNGNNVSGFFTLLEQNVNYVKIKSSNNILTIPYHRINKIKENKNIRMKGGKI